MIKSFKDLVVWQKSVDLVVLIYRRTSNLPKSELFGLISQMRRAVVAIPSNISEGKSRGTRKDYTHFLRIALSSTNELETQIIICKKLYKSVNFGKAEGLLLEVQKMLSTMIKKLEKS
jgi:four helix bundle protein